MAPRTRHHVQLPDGAPTDAFTVTVPGVSRTEFKPDSDGKIVTDEAGARLLASTWPAAVVIAPGGEQLDADGPHSSDATGDGDTAGGDAGTSA